MFIYGGIRQTTVGADFRAFAESGSLDLSRRHQVHDVVPCRQEVVSDDPAMAAPPERFGTHQGQALYFSELLEITQRRLEFVPEGIVSVIVKGPYAPEGIHRFVHLRKTRPARRSVVQRMGCHSFCYPTSVVIDVEGRIAGVWEGYTPSSVDQIESLVIRLLKQAANQKASS
jgi:hypothetical protein